MRERRPSNVDVDDDTSSAESTTIGEVRTDLLVQDIHMEQRQVLSPRGTGERSPLSATSIDNTHTSSKHSWNEKVDQLSLVDEKQQRTRLLRRPRTRSLWHCRLPLAVTTLFSVIVLWAIFHSYSYRQRDTKGCRMSYMWPSYARLEDFDTEHTRFASKYSMYLYREENVDDTSQSALVRPKGIPVLFIPGNAGSYKQVRPIASEAARMFAAQARANVSILQTGARPLDFFTVDFNEDITAFHGQTLLDQAEYLNEAVAYILSLYHDARKTTMESDLPDPASVILIGHSMGGIVARTMLVMPNYQSNSINTIITMSAPHAQPPVSFDADIVRTYERINSYWRKSYSAEWASHNPLWHVTLVSIAGGGLDTVVPSDYASVSSLVPETHGFTVFTSSVPTVWTSMDHQAILWCDQFRKVVARALLEIVNVKRPGQTKPRAERMRVLKKHFLTGMEPIAEQAIKDEPLTTLLTLESASQSIVPLGDSLVLRGLGEHGRPKAHLLPVPPRNGARGSTRFTFLSDRKIDNSEINAQIEVLVCSTFPLQAGQAQNFFHMNMDLSEETIAGTRLACKNAARDVILVPASTQLSRHPFEEVDPFSYLQYDLEEIGEHEFVAVVDKLHHSNHGWAIAQFSDVAQSDIQIQQSLGMLLAYGIQLTLPAQRPMVTDIHVPAIQSSLLSYKLSFGVQTCADGQLFTPLVRQYLSDPYESKFFVNVHQADISLHGSAPFMPEPLRRISDSGLSFQIWSDTTCNTPVEVSLVVDWAGSLGKIVMRYRTVVAAFPLVIVALVLRTQFREFDTTGTFIPFNEGLDEVLVHTLPGLLTVISMIGLFSALSHSSNNSSWLSFFLFRAEKAVDHTPVLSSLKNDTLIGMQDPFFWFLGPLFMLLSVGICTIINYIALILINIFTIIYTWAAGPPKWVSNEKRKSIPLPSSSNASSRRRALVTLVLFFFVATLVPYQFAYMVACLIQLVVCVKALRTAKESGHGTRSRPYWDFANYAHSLFILMLWILPINLPVLVVWIHNLAVHWLTPFSSHHNILSIMSFILLVEILTSGNMVPRQDNTVRHVTSILFIGVAAYAALYGVMYAYFLHHVVNIVAAWLVVLHFSATPISLSSLMDIFDPLDEPKKKP